MEKTAEPNFAQLSQDLLDAFLENAPFMGINQCSLNAAAKTIGINKGVLALIAPNGALSMIDAWFAAADAYMCEQIAAQPTLKIRQKATLAVKSRLEFLGRHKEALRRAIIILALPQNTPRALAIGYRFVDKAWRAFGDTSTDFNFYTKRTMLLGVDVSTMAYFLADESAGHNDTWGFLDRRIENIMQIEKAKAGFRKFKASLPELVPIVSKLRFGARPLP